MPTHAGIHPDFDIISYPFDVRQAIRVISEHFYVTRSFKPLQIGNSAYWAILVRPTDEFSVYVNTDREIVILFSTYETFEIRTLEAYDEIYDLLESKRADKSLRFLISSDERIEQTIRYYLDQHPEYPIIIPVTLAQITRGANSLLNAVRRNYLLRDLFAYQNPLREENFFFGRQSIVNTAIDMAKSGQNSSLFGLRKSGKTSAIYAIQRKAKGVSCIVVVIDCQNPSVHARHYNELLSYLLTETRKAIGIKKSHYDLKGSPAAVSEQFFQQMNDLLSSCKGVILLIFDEIENISPTTAASSHWRKDSDTLYFWQIVRSYIQAESKGRLSICIVGTSPYILEAPRINEIANPVYLYAQKTFIPNLSFQETRDMVQRLGYFMGLEFSEEVIADLQSEYGGHPFFIRQVCSRIHQKASTSRPVKVSKNALNQAKEEFSGQLEVYLRDIVDHLRTAYPDEFSLLQMVVTGNRDELSEFGREAPDLIDHLIGYGMVERVGDDFEIRLNAIKTVLVRIVAAETKDDRWSEIVTRRGNIETGIRIALFLWSKTVPSAEWQSLIHRSLSDRRLKELTSIEPSTLFSSSNSPLYLTDLIMILKDKTVLPYLEGRRSILLSHLDVVNRGRKDAHSNSFSDEEIAEVRQALLGLEQEFSTP